MASKASRKAALAALKAARDGTSSTRGLDHVHYAEAKDKNDDVYETMDEGRYREYVQGKLQREDFVVDDDGLGYHDDGDYDVMGWNGDDDPSSAQHAKKKKKGANALTKEALKKARRNKAAAAANSEGGEGTTKSKTMWDFMNKGTGVVAAQSVQGGGKSKKSGADVGGAGNARKTDALSNDLDDLMNEMLDCDAPTASSSRGRRSIGGRGRDDRRRGASSSHSRRGVATTSSRKRHRSSSAHGGGGRHPSQRGRPSHGGGRRREFETRRDRREEEEMEEDGPVNFGGNDHDDGGDNDDVDFGGGDNGDAFDAQDNDDDDNAVSEEAEEAAAAEGSNADVEMGEDKNGKGNDTSKDKEEAKAIVEEGKEAEASDAAPASKPKSRARPSRMAGRLSAVTAQRAKEAEARRLAEEKKEREEAEAAARNGKEAAAAAAAAAAKAKKGGGGGGPTAVIDVDTSSASFRSLGIAAAGSSTLDTTAGFGSAGMDLDRIIMMEEPVEKKKEVDDKEDSMEDDGEETSSSSASSGPRPYIDMYWLDASERNGEVTLYGKVRVPNNDAKAKKGGVQKPVYQSCCVTIPHNERNLFVLPRLKAQSTGSEDVGEEGSEQQQQRERHEIADVYAEMKSVLQPSCIPKASGANWKAKPVTRSYAFEDPSIPRGECTYLKVVYDGRYPVPDRQVCVHGGKTFEKILGAGASNLENFLIKRRLMGPGWVRLYDVKPQKGAPVSWCKWECVLDGPKSLKRLDLVSVNGGGKVEIPQPPPVSTVSIKFKTVVNPKSHKLEIVCVSGICHSNVMLDSASDESTRNMTALSIVRPVNFDTNGAMAQFPRDMDKELRAMPQLQTSPNERALLSRFFAQIGTWDPDVIVSHNGWGHDIDVLLQRCVELKVSMWSKIGRRRQMRLPSASQFGNGKDWAIASALDGRVLCDTCLSAKEFLRETTYSLANLAKTQLKVTERVEIEPVDVPAWCKTGEHFVSLAKHTLNDAQLVQGLMFKLQVLPLTKQLTNIAGNLWARTMKGNRAERNEYLLLHEFHTLKYLVPEKRSAKQRDEELLGGVEGGPTAGSNNKAKYSGGLVLEPKKGLYDSFILLLDFNSLYPSLIQEYNLCFTTMDWSKNNAPDSNADGMPQGDSLPSLPDESLDRGVLPRVIKTLVDRRRKVKSFMKNEKDADKKEELNIRQMALKLTANSMYGCLGFSHSRFYAQPIAALVTAMGRETLQRTVDLAQTTIGLEVIYGDTDSIMINTRITDINKYPEVLKLGNVVKREVNKLYKTLELEIDGVFRSMLLLKKKKYAAVTISEGPSGYIMGQETKGLDLVRRDWCIQSKDTGRYVLDQILSGEEKELVVNNIHEHLEKIAHQMRSGELPLEKYVITKGLNKHPNDYPDAKTLPHVYVARMMLKDHKAVSIGDHIPYVITSLQEEEGQTAPLSAKKALAAERARHPEEITRSNGALKPDVEWYLSQQILPPISRLCEPIEGTSPGILAEKLGLDSSKYNSYSVTVDEEDIVDYTPASCLPDEERFKNVEKFVMKCSGCDVEAEFPGAFRFTKDEETGMTFCQSGLRCPNPHCQRPDNWGEADQWSCASKILNKMNLLKKQQQKQYYDGLVRCDDPMCGLETRQLSVYEGCCLKPGCNGRMKTVHTESSLQTQLKYFDSLFDITHACKQLNKSSQSITEKEALKSISKDDKDALLLLHSVSSLSLNKSGYNWVSAQFFQTLFGVASR